MSYYSSDLPDEQEGEQIRYSDDITGSPMRRVGGVIMFSLGFFHLVRATIDGASGNLGAMFAFGAVSFFTFVLTLWYTGFFNHIFENTDSASLQQQAEERAVREGRAPSWHPDNLP